jgi:hypothetical protein
MSVHQMTTMAWFEFVKLVSHIQRVVNKGGEIERGQLN